MHTDDLIAVDNFCTCHNIEHSFVRALNETGLIQITIIEESAFLAVEQLSRLEKIIRFHYELDINLEGIETISHLLEVINLQQEEINRLSNRLRLFDLDD